MSATASAVTLDVNGLFDHMIGDGGLARADLEGVSDRALAVVGDIADRRGRGELPFLDLPYDQPAIAEAIDEGRRLSGRFSRMLVLGIGGSALGTRAVLEAISASARGDGLEVVVLDNVDPASVMAAIGSSDGSGLDDCCVNVVSKSGVTVETMAQFAIVRERLVARFGQDGYRERTVATTDPSGGTLRALADRDGLRCLPVPAGVGGRFSVLSAVGLMPIAAAGVDVEALCEGARASDPAAAGVLLDDAAATHAAVLYLALTRLGASTQVLMPYADGLAGLADWYVQLWAESLGKKTALDGSTVEAGQTPLAARGAADQHSQLQLFIDGPRDKVVSFVRVAEHPAGVAIPEGGGGIEDLECLAGRELGELLNIEQRATELALADQRRPTTVLEIARLDERSLGGLFYFLERQTLVMAGLLGIDPLGQPGVESGKRLAYAMAGHEAHAELRVSTERRLAAKKADLVLA